MMASVMGYLMGERLADEGACKGGCQACGIARFMPVGIVLEASAHSELHGMRKICRTKLA